ncbi:MAG: Dihydroflavonol-4-reductase [uncultured Solirubrobacteraceae bacterium]|uniref:Dihydroflavonol-4-reductase n=1 Tax=uncultured Solirubrobacteraceae bacterium TaxID=1162706 RepID=A0A6J4SQ10_9ACTN|nr:MAG: Dihydroflavonol-4-reductase [uncultured Solirubrobacteraceae bacterium]
MATTTLITGATGFIGERVMHALVERGDDVRATVRAGSRTDVVEELGVRCLTAEITDRRALRRAMKGVEHVFHVAGVTSLRLDEEETFRVNVAGTRAVLGEALRAGVERVVHTSSVAAIGPAPWGTTADETQVFRHGGLGIPYVSSKHAAELEALRYAARGLDLVTVCPTYVLGAGDRGRSSTDLVRRFMLRRIPAYVDGAVNVVDVEDVAAGHLLADEKGVRGERYILGNRNYTWERLLADLGRFSGIEPPAVRLPLAVALAGAAAVERAPGPTPLTPVEVRASGLWWAYRSSKARRELGWRTRPHEDTVEETIAYYREREGGRLARAGTRQPLGLRVAGFAARELTSRLGGGR